MRLSLHRRLGELTRLQRQSMALLELVHKRQTERLERLDMVRRTSTCRCLHPGSGSCHHVQPWFRPLGSSTGR